MTNKQVLLQFLQSQKLLVLATIDENNKPWITNVYFSINEEFEIFFVSPLDAKHSKHIENNSEVAFSTVWFDQDDLSNRKGIQGTGICKLITNPIEIAKHLDSHYQYFPSWKDSINIKNILKKAITSRPFTIMPSYIKFWNDELYGDKETEEFKINDNL